MLPGFRSRWTIPFELRAFIAHAATHTHSMTTHWPSHRCRCCRDNYTVIAEWLAVECTCLLHIGPPWPSNFITSICSGLVVRVVSALLHGNWQDFNWHDASRGPSAIAELLGFTRLSCKTKAYDQSKSSEKIRYGTISPFQNCVCEGGSWNGKSGAEAVFVYVIKSQCATRPGISTSHGILVGRQRWLTHQFVARR